MNFIKTILDKTNMLDSQQKLSLSNLTVALFVGICAFRMAFGGSTLNLGSFTWSIQIIDTAGTLPVLFGLLNYSHKRLTIDNANKNEKKEGN